MKFAKMPIKNCIRTLERIKDELRKVQAGNSRIDSVIARVDGAMVVYRSHLEAEIAIGNADA